MRGTDGDIIIIGAGPAGLMAAETVARAGVQAIVCERMAAPARKFLLAGRGGLNLTHGEAMAKFVTRYGAAAGRIAPMLAAFSPQDLRRWSEDLGEPTFVGSSGRVFPKSFKASPLLRAWLRRLASLGVVLRPRHRFLGWSSDGALRFETPDGEIELRAAATILALGGASWPKLGADGSWMQALLERGVGVAPLQPSNCGFEIPWSQVLRDKFAGAPLKSVMASFGAERTRGEIVVTAHGLEGGAIYSLSPQLRDAIAAQGEATLRIDLRPDVSEVELARRLAQPRGKQSASTFLRKAAGLAPVAIALLREAGPMPTEAGALAARAKNLPLRLTGVRPLARSISTAGGVRFDETDEFSMLKKAPGVFVAGEMLDWEAPTGGYLLQACFASGVVAGRGALAWRAKSAGLTATTTPSSLPQNPESI